MLRNKIFLIGFLLLFIGVGLIIFFMMVPMQGDNEKIKLPSSTHIPAPSHTLVDSPVGHNKTTQKVILRNPNPIVVSSFSHENIQLSFLVHGIDVQNVHITAKTDDEITVNVQQVDYLPINNEIIYPFTLETSEAGKFYIMFHSRIDTLDARVQSAPVGVLVQVIE